MTIEVSKPSVKKPTPVPPTPVPTPTIPVLPPLPPVIPPTGAAEATSLAWPLIVGLGTSALLVIRLRRRR